MNLTTLVFWIIQISIHGVGVFSKTKAPDVSALNVMFSSLNSPSQLTGWGSSGGDPCGDSWEGIKCSGSSVTEISLSDFGLSGSMGYQLSNLASVTYFDLSKNSLSGDIPYQLPPNAVHIDLSGNSFTGSVPYSISQMTELEFLNLGHNQLSNQLSDMFGKLAKLKRLDLSFNKISGNLPQSFKKLSSLTVLHIQDNKFSGSINVLADLPLDDLNVANNKFTGWIPESLEDIDNLETVGNSWSTGPAPPPPPGTVSPTSKKSNKEESNKNSAVKSGLVIAGIAMGVLAVIAVVIGMTSKRRRHVSHYLDEDTSQHRSFTPLTSQELSKGNDSNNNNGIDRKSFNSDASIDIKSGVSVVRPPPAPLDPVRSFSDNQFATRLNSRTRSTSFRATSYSLVDLQTATANFAPARLLGEGTIGRVYKAKFGDGKVLAVKKIDSSVFQGRRTEEFSEVVTIISKLNHTNIAEVVGYCSEQGHHLLIYEFFPNGSLHEFLHMSDDFSKPLTWNTRVRIALGTARALEYLHEVCSPSIIHMNIKSSNILLDAELNPRLSDYGLATFYKSRSQNPGGGYEAPECSTKGSSYTLKSDIHSLGVVMLELLTGRMPYDSSKAKVEQCLVRWATPQLHDIDALDKMVDPALRGLYPPKSVSRFADIIALCVQSEPEFRPPMSEVVQALVTLVQRSSMNMRDDLGNSRRMDDYDY
ncbi:protein STRUBBELIG-RECEPTOR FAMILY 5-like [Cucumis melo var. makuwa]|uniref:Protein STRUBBELIG-RECEPTOR FAMILY 5-like n=1 Tax=Cucumis melo var. makuwa TaxID=1194695 RepID=A0A5D3BMW5_CUCMM|nr:protein STRUBBELIG-RECEPTOR FAMILY 5-like [Cucumis melo var. makuwa]